VCANNHFKCFSIAVNGRPVLFTFTGIHFFVIYSLDARARDSARNIFGETERWIGFSEDDRRQAAEGADIGR
jgi:hypothetical protein